MFHSVASKLGPRRSCTRILQSPHLYHPLSLCPCDTLLSPPSAIVGPPTDLTGFLLLPGWGSWRKDQPLRVSSQEQPLSRPGFPTLASAPPFSQGRPALPTHFYCASEGDFPKRKSGPIPSRLIFSVAPHYLQEKIQVIQGVDCPWLTSQTPLPRPNLQPHL